MVTLAGGVLHRACVTCFFCAKSLGAAGPGGGLKGWKAHSGGAVCPECYWREVVPVCERCSQPTEDGISSGACHWDRFGC